MIREGQRIGAKTLKRWASRYAGLSVFAAVRWLSDRKMAAEGVRRSFCGRSTEHMVGDSAGLAATVIDALHPQRVL
jgi:hypothetical protein